MSVKLLPFSSSLAVLAILAGHTAHADDDFHHNGNRHVLLISIDGMHALDLQNCVAAKTCPNLAALTETGISGSEYPPLSDMAPAAFYEECEISEQFGYFEVQVIDGDEV